MSDFNYFTLEKAIDVHRFIIERSGGLGGVKNIEHLKAILGFVQNNDYYPDLIDKVTFIVFAINKDHVFHDGNKRGSIALSSFLLELNDYDCAVQEYSYGMEEVVIWLACNLIDKCQLKQIIEFLLSRKIGDVKYFILTVRRLRYFIEQGIIDKILLEQTINKLLSSDMQLSDDTLAAVLSAISD